MHYWFLANWTAEFPEQGRKNKTKNKSIVMGPFSPTFSGTLIARNLFSHVKNKTKKMQKWQYHVCWAHLFHTRAVFQLYLAICAEGLSRSWVNDKSMGGKGANFTKDCLFHHCPLSVLSMNLMSKADLKYTYPFARDSFSGSSMPLTADI